MPLHEAMMTKTSFIMSYSITRPQRVISKVLYNTYNVNACRTAMKMVEYIKTLTHYNTLPTLACLRHLLQIHLGALGHSPIWYNMAYIHWLKQNMNQEIKFTNHPMGKLWGVQCQDLWENWFHCNGTALYLHQRISKFHGDAIFKHFASQKIPC